MELIFPLTSILASEPEICGCCSLGGWIRLRVSNSYCEPVAICPRMMTFVGDWPLQVGEIRTMLLTSRDKLQVWVWKNGFVCLEQCWAKPRRSCSTTLTS